MNNPDNDSNKNFVMNDSETSENTFDHYDNKTYETLNESYRKPLFMPLIIAAVGFLIVIILLIAIISRGQDLAERKQILAIEERLNFLAERIDRVESIVNSKMDEVIREIERKNQTTTITKTPAVKAAPPPTKEQKEVNPKIHKVQAGDTLYQISRHYGISIAQLRAYNKLEQNTKIYPGQELKLSP